MFNLGTLVICCACCLFAGIMFGDWKSARECSKMAQDLAKIYSEDMEYLVNKIIELRNKENQS